MLSTKLTNLRFGTFQALQKGLELVSGSNNCLDENCDSHSSDEATLRRSLFEHTGGSYPEVRRHV